MISRTMGFYFSEGTTIIHSKLDVLNHKSQNKTRMNFVI